MLVGLGGLEPPTLRLSGVRSNHLSYRPFSWGVCSWVPFWRKAGPGRRERFFFLSLFPARPVPSKPGRRIVRGAFLARVFPRRGRVGTRARRNVPRKEVIQPHLPVRLPCYDFVPIASHTFGALVPREGVPPATSGTADFRDVTGGVYKARELIHRGILIRDY